MSGALRRGFTLLEVLAAVAVLAIAYTVLAGTAMQGLANEGETYRRLRASTLADLTISQIEAGLAVAAPPVDESATEFEDFVVVTEVRPYDLGAFALAVQEEATGRRKLLKGSEAGATPPFQLLTVPPGAKASPLLEIVVRVRWLEGAYEREVTRTTFAADPQLVQQAVASLPGANGQDAPGEATPEGDAADEPVGGDLPGESDAEADELLE